jgi:hypothetical protein
MIPNVRATVQEIHDGLTVASQNRGPLDRDLMAVNDWLCRPSWARGSTTRPSCGRAPSGKGSTSRSSAAPPGWGG